MFVRSTVGVSASTLNASGKGVFKGAFLPTAMAFRKGPTTSVGDCLEQGQSALNAAVRYSLQRSKREMALSAKCAHRLLYERPRFPAYKDLIWLYLRAGDQRGPACAQLHRLRVHGRG